MVKRLIHKVAKWVARKTAPPRKTRNADGSIHIPIAGDASAFKKAVEETAAMRAELDRMFPKLTGEADE